MGKMALDKYFGARLISYAGLDYLDRVGQAGVLIVYDYVGVEGECLPIFYFDEGRAVGWLWHLRSRCAVEGALPLAALICFGTVRERRI